MRKVITILGAIAALFAVGSAALTYFHLVGLETEKNKAQTANATAARWQKKNEEQPKTESDESTK